MDIQTIGDLISNVGLSAACMVGLFYLIVKDNSKTHELLSKLNDNIVEIKGAIVTGRGDADD